MKVRRFVFVAFVWILINLIITACSVPQNNTYDSLLEYANTVKVINTHEHQRLPSELDFEKYNFWVLLSKAYLNSDLVSAGAMYLNPATLNSKSLDELWDENAEFLTYASNTSYYQHFLEGIRKCYEFDKKEFSKKDIEFLSEQIAEN
ncbi:MAG: hypothetical protein R3182_01980, partial [Draconibacterium sp.]|nr:hypothetical protein [Draconibacterium sp.]